MYGAEVWQIRTREINKIVDISFLSGCTRRSLAESDDTRGCMCTICVVDLSVDERTALETCGGI
jgi:hypothetical protein